MPNVSTLSERLEMYENPENRIPCVIVIDTSSSMLGQPIREVNAGIRRFFEEINSDELTALRADIAIIAFNHGHSVVVNFGADLDPDETELQANGGTVMSEPLTTALDMIERRKETYRENGVAYYRPIVILITDGYPNDRTVLDTVAQRIRSEEAGNKIMFFPIGTEDADMDTLASLSVRRPKTLQGTKFTELFQWLSNSISRISQSQMGEKVLLPPTDDWAIYQ